MQLSVIILYVVSIFFSLPIFGMEMEEREITKKRRIETEEVSVSTGCENYKNVVIGIFRGKTDLNSLIQKLKEEKKDIEGTVLRKLVTYFGTLAEKIQKEKKLSDEMLYEFAYLGTLKHFIKNITTQTEEAMYLSKCFSTNVQSWASPLFMAALNEDTHFFENLIHNRNLLGIDINALDKEGNPIIIVLAKKLLQVLNKELQKRTSDKIVKESFVTSRQFFIIMFNRLVNLNDLNKNLTDNQGKSVQSYIDDVNDLARELLVWM